MGKNMKFQNFIDKLGSRKFQILIIAVVAFYTSPKFTGEHLLIAMCTYMGFNIFQKFIEGRK